MKKRLTLDETWTLCLKMWKWIAAQKKAGSRKKVNTLKNEWRRQHYPRKQVFLDCFFCEYAKGVSCEDGCPGILVNSKFNCINDAYAFDEKPIAFYKKLVELNKKRNAKRKNK